MILLLIILLDILISMFTFACGLVPISVCFVLLFCFLNFYFYFLKPRHSVHREYILYLDNFYCLSLMIRLEVLNALLF